MIPNLRQIYRDSLKPADSLFNLYLARPLAAAWVALFARTAITPNQVTLLSMAVMLLSAAPLLLWPGAWGLALGVILIELSYVLDCADGQLARLTGRTSEAGARLDFLMDELKALLLIAALSGRWHLYDGGEEAALWVGVITLGLLAGALSLTRFLRSPEYARATGTTPLKDGEAAGEASARRGPLWPVKAAARLISQYPATLPLFALVGRMDFFLYAYAGVHALYVAQCSAVIVWRLGRATPPGPKPPGEAS